MNITSRLGKVDEKYGVIFLPELWSVNCQKKLYFLQFCAELSKKSKSNKAIYIYASERSRYALSEIGVVYYAMTYCFGGASI